MPFFTGKSVNPIEFLRQFNAAVEDFGSSEKEKVKMFKAMVRVQDDSLKEDLNPKKDTLKRYQKAFKKEYYTGERNKNSSKLSSGTLK